MREMILVRRHGGADSQFVPELRGKLEHTDFDEASVAVGLKDYDYNRLYANSFWRIEGDHLVVYTEHDGYHVYLYSEVAYTTGPPHEKYGSYSDGRPKRRLSQKLSRLSELTQQMQAVLNDIDDQRRADLDRSKALRNPSLPNLKPTPVKATCRFETDVDRYLPHNGHEVVVTTSGNGEAMVTCCQCVGSKSFYALENELKPLPDPDPLFDDGTDWQAVLYALDVLEETPLVGLTDVLVGVRHLLGIDDGARFTSHVFGGDGFRQAYFELDFSLPYDRDATQREFIALLKITIEEGIVGHGREE